MDEDEKNIQLDERHISAVVALAFAMILILVPGVLTTSKKMMPARMTEKTCGYAGLFGVWQLFWPKWAICLPG